MKCTQIKRPQQSPGEDFGIHGSKAERDSVLEVSLRPDDGARGHTVLLIGVTGLAGREVLKRLLRPGRHSAVLGFPEAGKAIAGGRLEVWEADLSAPGLGLSPAQHEDVTQNVGTILHCAADLSFAHRCDDLRAVNVVATRDLIAITGVGFSKRMVLVSSASVLEAPLPHGHADERERPTREEASPLPAPEDLPVAYARTKWAADTPGAAAQRVGFDVTIVRLPWITANGATTRLTTGIFWIVLRAHVLRLAAFPGGRSPGTWSMQAFWRTW
ncbi:MAG: SDR family oxidoreductase [Pseudomonadota bacterium]